MKQSLLDVGLVLAKTLKDDGVGTLAKHFDLASRTADDRGHALASRVELADVQNVILVVTSPDVDDDRLWLARLRHS